MSKESIPAINIPANNANKANSQATTPVINMMAPINILPNTRTNNQKKYKRYTNGIHMIANTHRIKNGVPQDLINGIWESPFTPKEVPPQLSIPPNAVNIPIKKGGRKQTRRGRKSLRRTRRTRR